MEGAPRLSQVPFPPAQQIRSELLAALKFLQERHLHNAAKWASEQALSLDKASLRTLPTVEPPVASGEAEKEVEGDAGASFSLAQSFFALKEFRRCAALLTNPRSTRAAFLHAYALYLAGEEVKEKEMAEGEGASVTNKELQSIDKFLSAFVRQFGATVGSAASNDQRSGEGLLLYINGVVARDLEQMERAMSLLVRSVTLFPCNFSAWIDLVALVTGDELAIHSVPEHWMRNVFLGHLLLETQDNQAALPLLSSLQVTFPSSSYFLAQKALAHYNLREFDAAESLFEKLVENDPHRLENMDNYSNILYVKENRPRLAYLAHMAHLYHPYRPETCCIIGNYYSLKSEHERAVIYFQRALKLNRKMLSAWTLMGHEYLELKNTSAAVHAYRKAVDISPREYRAWYGLGQTYEILKMPQYATHYYRKAAFLRPYDARMWCALGGCYESLGKPREAIKCYERAEANNDREAIALDKLASLHHQLGEEEKAALYYKRNLERRNAEEDEGQSTIEALLFLANYCKGRGQLAEAENYCQRLLDFPGKEKEEAKALLREIHAMSQQGMV